MPNPHPLRKRSARRRVGLVVLGIAGQVALMLGSPLFHGCGAEDSTHGKRVILHTRIELVPYGASFVTGLGWRVILQRTLLSTGKLAYFDGAPPTARFSPRRPVLERLLGVSVAYAHPGHYQAGTALGEMSEPWSVSLRTRPSELSDGYGVTGSYRSARFSFGETPVGPLADELAGHVALVEGTAELDGEETRYFRAVADFAEVAASQANAEINGCEFQSDNVDQGGTIHVQVEPEVWFNLVDFAELDPGSADEPAEFAADTQPRIAFAQGLAQLSAYTFVYSPRSAP